MVKRPVDLGLKHLKRRESSALNPILKDRGLVSQAEDSLIVTNDGSEVINKDLIGLSDFFGRALEPNLYMLFTAQKVRLYIRMMLDGRPRKSGP